MAESVITFACVQPQLFCQLCGEMLMYFHSKENQKWFVAHHRFKAIRDSEALPPCQDMKKVWDAPVIRLSIASRKHTKTDQFGHRVDDKGNRVFDPECDECTKVKEGSHR